MIWSYSMLNTYDICPRRFYFMYVAPKGTIPREDKSPQQLYGDRAHEALKKRLRLDDPLPEEFQAYEPWARQVVDMHHPMHVELKLGIRRDGTGCDFFAADVYGRGTVDVLLLPAGNAMLLDWKTGKVREDPTELAVQAVLLRAKFRDLGRIVGHYVWLQPNAIGTQHDVSDTEKTLAWIEKTMARIEDRTMSGNWPPDEGPLCGYCSVKKPLCEYNRS